MSMGFKAIERLGYWQGQELRARDLESQTESLEQLRWWHNRAVHAVYGVSQGLAVTVSDDGKTVMVGCGLAYDCFGRELILSEQRQIVLPTGDGVRILVISHAGLNPMLGFVSWNDFRAAHGVPIALFTAGTPIAIDKSFRAPAARALSRPRLGAGSTVPGNTAWEKLPSDAGLQVLIDTSSAGFTQTPFYLASLIWQRENTRFSAPIVSIANSSERDFRVRLLLKDVGREKFALVSGAGLVDTVNPLALRKTIQFAPGQKFQANDVLARVAPRADLALPISAVAGTTLTLGASSTDWTPAPGETVVLGSLPAVAKVSGVLTALSVGKPERFDGIPAIFRMAGKAAGAAAAIEDKTKQGVLLLATPLADYSAGDELGTIAPTGKVTLKNAGGTLIALDQSTAALDGAIVIRLSDHIATEKPATVNRNADGTLTLAASIGLQNGDELGVVNQVTTGQAATTALTVDDPSRFQDDDLIGVGSTQPTNSLSAILSHVDGSNLILASTMAPAIGSTVINADFPLRTTARFNLPQAFFAGSVAPFQTYPFAAHLQGARVVDASPISQVFPQFNAVALAQPMPKLSGGEVVAGARFARTGIVQTPGAGANALVVQMKSSADAAVFRAGDTVARINSGGPVALAVITQVTGDTLRLSSALPGLKANETLGIVTLHVAVVVTDPPVGAGAHQIAVDLADFARSGGVVARFTGWTDVSRPVTLLSNGLSPVLSDLPDGMMSGDALAFAALSPQQPVIRFDASARIGGQTLTLAGVDQVTGSPVEVTALVTSLVDQQATLQFIGAGSGFSFRPEGNLTITGSSQIDDFLAYAQQQGLSVAWLGCQMPLPEDPVCPGLIANPCSCK